MFFIASVFSASNLPAVELTHEMTNAERALMPDYLQRVKQRAYTAPSGPVRSIAEFEYMAGALIAYPLGIPVSTVKELAEDDIVYTIVNDSNVQSSVNSYYTKNGVNTANCRYVKAPHDSYWTRDYGPMFIAGQDNISVLNFTYNRPRPSDNNIPVAIANVLGIQYYTMDLVHCGGNYMTDGLGIAVSTNLIYDENPNKSNAEIDQIVLSYLGIETYHVTSDPLGDYIKHVDCWGKFLSADKVLITKVPASKSNYNDYEEMTDFFKNQISSYGTPYKVYRVYSPNGEPYTNSLILNKKVYVPLKNSSADSAAIDAYKTAMPGYEVIGVYGSWYSTDALHCRVIGLADPGMLYIEHIPLNGEVAAREGYVIHADIKAYSGAGLKDETVGVLYRINGGSYDFIQMNNSGAGTYSASIPSQPGGSIVEYYIHAEDYSGRKSDHPLIGKGNPYVFTVKSQLSEKPAAAFSADTLAIETGASVKFTDASVNTPTEWNWTFTGGIPSSSTEQHPVVTYNSAGTFSVTLTVTNQYGTDTVTKTNFITVNDNEPEYCTSKGNNFRYEWIQGVEIDGFTNFSNAAGYTDFSGKIIELNSGSSVAVTLTPGFSSKSYDEYWILWIDLNRDGDFTDPGEMVFSVNAASAVSGTIEVPYVDSTIVTRMRITMKYSSQPQSCGNFSYGEVEDYTVSIHN